jgi:hypothetical protein
VRYYLYISDAKVDMLLPQIPGALRRKVSAKFGFDIKVLSGSLETERTTLDDRIARLAAVEEYLLENEPIGSPSQPASWIQGTVDAKFMDLGDGAALFLTGAPSWILALGGSAYHLVGASKPEQVCIPFSFLPNLTGHLTRLAEDHPELLVGSSEDVLRHLGPEVDREFENWIEIVKWAFHNAKVTDQRIEFLAKRLVSKKGNGDTVTMASPLYVASAE